MSDYYLKPTPPIKTTIDNYYYKFNELETLSGISEDWLIIIFENGKFDRLSVNEPCRFDVLTAKEMKLMDLINQEIKRLEESYK